MIENKQIDEQVFLSWCKKQITGLLHEYEKMPDYQDLSQDCFLAAYQCRRSCQAKNQPVNYPIITRKLKTIIGRKAKAYNNGGITYSGKTDIQIENDVENKAIA